MGSNAGDEEAVDYEGDAGAEEQPAMQGGEADAHDDMKVDADQETEAVPEGNDDAQGHGEQQEDAQPGDEALNAETDMADTDAATGEPQQDPTHEHHEDDDHRDTSAAGTDPMSLPPFGCEIFVGNMPNTATEQQIKEFCASAGEIFKVYIPRDPNLATGTHKGYAFVEYTDKVGAENAMKDLDNKEFPGAADKKVRVRPASATNKLYMEGLPRDISKADLLTALKATTPGVEDVELVMSKDNPHWNRGFCFVSFYNKACALKGLDAFQSSQFKLPKQDRDISVRWAEPRKGNEQDKVRSVYVSGLPDAATEAALQELFEVYGEVERVIVPPSKEDPKKHRGFGFVHFKDRSSAAKAVDSSARDRLKMDGSTLEVALAKPQQDRSRMGGGYGGGGGYGNGGYGGGYGQMHDGGYRNYGGQGPRGYGRMGGRGGRFGGGGFQGRGRGRSPGYAMQEYGGYDDYGGGYDDYDDGSYGYEGYENYGYGYGYGSYGGMGLVPMMLPTGQVGFMMSGPAAAAAAGGRSDMRSDMRGGSGGVPRDYSPRESQRGPRGSYGGSYGGGGGGSGGGYGASRSGPSRSYNDDYRYSDRGAAPARRGTPRSMDSSRMPGPPRDRYRPY